MVYKQLSIIIVLLHSATVSCATAQPDITARCAAQLLAHTISYRGSPEDKRPQKARDIIALLKQCPGSHTDQAERAAALVPNSYYGWWSVCKQWGVHKQTRNPDPRCQRYKKHVEAAQELFVPKSFFREIKQKASENQLMRK